MSTTAVAPEPIAPTHQLASERVWTIGGREYRVVPPSFSDPRVHLSLIILSIHFLGQFWLNFRISLAQIAVTIVTCAAIEVVYNYRRNQVIVWPASALNTGIGVALVFRVIGTENGDYWSLQGWYWFVMIAAGALLTKYVIRYRGQHIFNPSNVALVVAFLLLGSTRVEPLDYWWAPMGPAMALAYVILLVGGLTLTRRLNLFGLSFTFWSTLAIGTAVLAAQGHCITTRWSFVPVCGLHFWWIIVTSPEVLVFLFFMITDPRTVPRGRVARVAFGFTLGVVCTMLIAPWDTEFGAKVGLLAGLVLMTMFRPLFDRAFPAAGSGEDQLGPYLVQLVGSERDAKGTAQLMAGGAVGIVAISVLSIGVAFAGLPNSRSDGGVDAETTEAALAVVPAVDPATVPAVSIDPDVAELSATLATPEGAQDLAATFHWNLLVEAEAMASGDADLLPAANHGDRLIENTEAVEAAATAEQRVIREYEFDTLILTVVFPGGFQAGANAGFVVDGTVTETTLGPDGQEVASQSGPIAGTFAMFQPTAGTWLNSDFLTSGENDDMLPMQGGMS